MTIDFYDKAGNNFVWEHNHKYIGDKIMQFSENVTAKKYTIPLDEIESGDCYCVVVHFADGTSAASEVMCKK